MATTQFFKRSELERGVRPLKGSNIDGTGMAALLKSRAHTHLRERLHTAKSSEFVVFEATGDSMLRRCIGAELRTKLRTVVLPLASERRTRLEPQAIMDQRDHPPTYAPLFDNDNEGVPYLVSFFLTPLALPETLTLESAKLLSPDPAVDQLVCVLQPNVLERPAKLLAIDAIMGTLSHQFPVRHLCGGCNMVVDGRLKCSACRKAVYCGQACQKAHWSNGHKHECVR